MAIDEGSLSLQDKVVSFFPDYFHPNKPGSKMATLTVEDLLTRTSGHATGVSGGTWRSVTTSWITEFFKISVAHQLGTFFRYTSATSFLLSAIIHLTTGQRTFQFLMPRLFQVLGIRDLKWDIGLEGINPGGNWNYLSALRLVEIGHIASQWRNFGLSTAALGRMGQTGH